MTHDDDARVADLIGRLGDGDTKDLFCRLLERGMQDLIDAELTTAIGAERTSDWDELRLLLHPYWTSSDTRTIRGRRNVLAYLAATRPAGSPTEYELRDAQIYRWKEPGGIG